MGPFFSFRAQGVDGVLLGGCAARDEAGDDREEDRDGEHDEGGPPLKIRDHAEVEGATDREVQDEIDFILDTLYWDPEKKCVMQSVTVQGGDVEQRFYSR